MIEPEVKAEGEGAEGEEAEAISAETESVEAEENPPAGDESGEVDETSVPDEVFEAAAEALEPSDEVTEDEAEPDRPMDELNGVDPSEEGA